MPNWDEIRQRFPPALNWTYLNTAAGGPVCQYAADAARQYYVEAQAAGDTRWDDWLARMEATRTAAARFVNARPEEIAFVANTSLGLNLAIQMLPPGEVVLLRDDFPSVTLPWINRGFPVRFVEAEADGVVPVERIAEAIGPDTRYVAVGYVQFRSGFRHDLERLGALCAERGLSLIVDATQAAGVFKLDVQSQHIAVLAFSGYKWLLAGYGISALYVSRKILESRPLPAVGWRSAEVPYDLISDRLILTRHASGLELGHPLFAGIFALGGSLRLLQEIGPPAIEARAHELTEILHGALDAHGIPVFSPRGKEHRSAITMVEVSDAPAVAAKLKERRVLVSARGRGLRVSPHFYNNREDVERFVTALDDIRAQRRGGS